MTVGVGGRRGGGARALPGEEGGTANTNGWEEEILVVYL